MIMTNINGCKINIPYIVYILGIIIRVKDKNYEINVPEI